PYVLFTTLVYALFRKVKLFDEGQAIDILFSMTIGFFVINYTSLGIFLSHLFSVASLFIAMSVVIVLVTASLGMNFPEYIAQRPGTALMLMVLAATFILIEVGIDDFLPNVDSMTIKIILLVTVLIAAVSLASKIPEK
ncbi:MAG: hypothetical protein KAJ56_01810, partial [Candidatus Aenigmarchaeota archaeon]|nr:hypothetical protein [Candidatus Aenigmarchaeota archaeon]